MLPIAPTSATTSSRYRKDIDGLRAIAVLLVVGFHAFPKLLPGGFVGVDIFFVISGFLIGGIIFEELAKQSFSFVHFYARRVRRIAPALVVVLGACLCIGYGVLAQNEFKQLGKHVVLGTLFSANFGYYSEAGYFDSSADAKPLLHLWSLGIEEQFYFFCPAIMWLGWRFRFNLLAVSAAVTLLSFAINVAFLPRWTPDALFYLPVTRVWELMLGVLLAGLGERNPIKANAIAAAFGLFCIALAVAFLTGSSRFPGWWALLPTMGTCLIIGAGPGPRINKLLSNRIMGWFGLISFPLYLWHWPLLSFARITEGAGWATSSSVEIGLSKTCVLVAASIVLSWLTYRLVEIPLRFGRISNNLWRTVGLMFAMLGVTWCGALIYQKMAFPLALRPIS